jgi:aspartyl-tRNA(Asn)/glutamyl-tRNA(Gln) amidotransferase subunit A
LTDREALSVAARRFAARPDGDTWFVEARWEPAAEPPPGPLQGVAMAVKSNIAVASFRTVAGSAALEDDAPAAADSAVVAGLRAAGATIVGSLNMNELAYGFTGRNARYGDVANPHDADRLSGGSSSASAAVVGAGVLDAALGTDTNGSIRVPAALCGVWGLRPSTGSVATTGVVPLAPTLDVPGPLAADLALLTALADALGVPTGWDGDLTSLRVATVRGFPNDWVAPVVADAVRTVATILGAGAEVELTWAAAARAAAQVLTAAEGATNHLGLLRDRAGALEPLTRARLRAGLALEPAIVARALGARHRMLAAEDLLGGADVLIVPTVPVPAPRSDVELVELDGVSEPVNAALGRCTAPFSFVGCPALAVPLLLSDDAGLPLSVQLVARPGQDALLLLLATVLEADGIAAARTATEGSAV